MPTLADRALVNRPVYFFNDELYRLKVRGDLTFNDMLTLIAGPQENPDAALRVICYDAPPASVEWVDFVAAWDMFYAALSDDDIPGESDTGTPSLDLQHIIPRLQREFGSPGGRDWMDVPMWEISMYSEALTPLYAEEGMRWLQLLTVGSGRVTEQTARGVWRDLQRDARQGMPKQAKKKPVSEAEFTARLALLGIGFQKV